MRVRLPSALPVLFPDRLMVGHLTLTQRMVVRAHLGDPVYCPMVQLAAHLTLIQEVPRSNRGGAST